MASTSPLLSRITIPGSRQTPLLAPLGTVMTQLTRGFWESRVVRSPIRQSADDCLILGSKHIEAYTVTGGDGWASYDAIERAFSDRNRERLSEGPAFGAKTSPLPRDLIDADLKLLIRDTDTPLQCVVVWERVYPRRAWVGTVHPTLTNEMAFVIAGILNSAIGQVLYRRASGKLNGGPCDLRKRCLSEICIPLLGYERDVFAQSALLSYRLHCLYAADRECGLPADIHDSVIPSHRQFLLSELTRLYGYSETDGRKLVERVLPAGLNDVPGVQGHLYYQPRTPPEAVVLAPPSTRARYEELKSHSRAGTASAGDSEDLRRIQLLLAWEDRINGPIPKTLRPQPWSPPRDAASVVRLADRSE